MPKPTPEDSSFKRKLSKREKKELKKQEKKEQKVKDGKADESMADKLYTGKKFSLILNPDSVFKAIHKRDFEIFQRSQFSSNERT